MLRLSIILPVWNEAGVVVNALSALQPLRQRGHQVILVDGGSADATLALGRPLADVALGAARGRALQMNRGAAEASGEVLLFLHVDTRLPDGADVLIEAALQGDRVWGRFDVRLSGQRPVFRLIERLMNWRSRCTGIATGDQAIFVLAASFRQAGGWPPLPLMEDVALSRRLKRLSPPACLPQRVTADSRRWEQSGIARTVLTMWALRLAFFLGVDARRLARIYERL